MVNIFELLLNRSITAGWLILVVLVLRMLFRKAPKNFRLILWALVAARLICPTTITSPLSLVPNQEMIQITRDSEVQLPISENISAQEISEEPIVQHQESYKVYESVRPVFRWERIGAYVWLAGIAVMLIYSLVSFWKLKRKVSVSVAAEENVWLCDTIDTPFVIGILKPRIYLPSGLSKEEAAYVLLHEKAHVMRKDPLWKMIAFLLVTVYWFHPLMWAGYFFFAKDMELACDEAVIRSMELEYRKDYSRVLLNISSSRHQLPACPLAFGEVGVKERIKQILNYKKPGFWISVVSVLAVVMFAVCFLTQQENIGIIGGADGPTSIFVGRQESSTGHMDFEMVQAQIAALPGDPEELKASGCFVLDYRAAEWNQTANMEVWEQFCEQVEHKIPSDIVIAQISTKGSVAFDYISYNGENYYHVCDLSRMKAVDSEAESYEETYQYFYVFQQADEVGKRSQIVLLSDIPYLKYEVFLEADSGALEGERPQYRSIALVSLARENDELYVDNSYSEDITDEGMNDRFQQEYGWTRGYS